MTQIPVFVISLEKSIERRNSINRKLEELGVEFEFFKAIDGRDLPEEQILEIQKRCGDLVRVRGFPMQTGEIGCSLSHHALYQKIINENIDYACILEDDATFTSDFVNCINRENVKTVFNKECIIMLGHFLYGSPQKVLTKFWNRIGFTDKTNLKIPIQGNHGSYGYIIDKKTADKILNSLYTITVPIDDLTGSAELNGITRFVADPPVVLVNSALESLMTERIKWNEKIFKMSHSSIDSRSFMLKVVLHLKHAFQKFKRRIFHVGLQLGILDKNKEILNFRVSGFRMK
jgi:glycosyl transferase, family 25